MRLELLETLLFDGHEVAPGEEIEISDELGADLVEREVAREAGKPAKRGRRAKAKTDDETDETTEVETSDDEETETE